MENIKLTPKRNEMLKAMGFDSIASCLRYYPYRFDRYENVKLDYSLNDTKVCIEGVICKKPSLVKLKNKQTITTVYVTHDEREIKLVFFNRFYTISFFKIGVSIVVLGKYNALAHEIVVSSYFFGSLNGGIKLVPQYSLPTQFSDTSYKNLINYLLKEEDNLHVLKEIVPNDFLKKYHLVSLNEAIHKIHQPLNDEDLKQAYRYLKYEEFLTFCGLGAYKKDVLSLKNGLKNKKVNMDFVYDFARHLPFSLTEDQKIAVREIINDLNSNKLMSRLLQGDVGSGKTIVAIIALVANYSSSYQGALMAPTDILARQHFNKIKILLEPFNIKVSLLVSDMKASEKNKTLKALEKGDIDIIIGTHALISANVKYNKLGLAIVDEQHRFGVNQRVLLKEKGKQVDVLYMSATPIPRTLAATIYMDMDVSTIAAYPYKERKIKTMFFKDNSISKVKEFILSYLKSKQQIYIVCPCINESKAELANVNEIYIKWAKEFKDYQVGLLHGKLKSDEKNKVMTDFSNNEIQILVSTTVIEVGIDVFNANMMIIYDADRFGLAQLHQLRGRIARDGKKGYCYLLSSNDDIDVIERLSYLESHSDGFAISEYDLKRRGAGDMLGLAQSGKSPFVIANLIDDFAILKEASKDASFILKNKNNYQSFIAYLALIMANVKQDVD